MVNGSNLSPEELSAKLVSDVTVYTKYAKYREDKNRRANWSEIVDDVVAMHKRKHPSLAEDIDRAFKFVYDKKVIPSMRSMQFAGRAIELGESRIYNCAFLPIDHRIAFREVMFLLMGGTGVGYSVQKHHVAKLPAIKKPEDSQRYVIGDSIEGWSDAVNRLCKAYFEGKTRPIFIYDDIRPAGSILKKSGGKSPGPTKLRATLLAIESVFKNAIGRKLDTIEVHDIVCYIANCIVAGGIRDSAMIALFSHDDSHMATAKGNVPVTVSDYADGIASISIDVDRCISSGISPSIYGLNFFRMSMSEGEFTALKTSKSLPWWNFHPQRGKSNNSAMLVRGDTTREEFDVLWKQTQESGAGEPAIYWSSSTEWGSNPCVEIALRPFQFCNLTSVNGASVTSQEDFEERVRAAAFIGTLQASYTDFHYLRRIWKETTEKEALLGVSITGIAYGNLKGLDHAKAAKVGLTENARVADIIGIKRAARVTCIKPEGSGSLALGVLGAGIHAVHDKFFIRRIRYNINSAMHEYLMNAIPDLIEVDKFDDQKAIISIPIKAPAGAITRGETALEFCDRIKFYSQEWVKAGHRRGQNGHNVSATIYVKDTEWSALGDWMWDNRDAYNGLSCLPYDGGTYVQAPYETITEDKYYEILSKIRDISLDGIVEMQDMTNLVSEKACANGICEI